MHIFLHNNLGIGIHRALVHIGIFLSLSSILCTLWEAEREVVVMVPQSVQQLLVEDSLWQMHRQPKWRRPSTSLGENVCVREWNAS